MKHTRPAHLLAPIVGTGALMAAYLLLRPYGDSAGATTPEAAATFASTHWVAAHLCGALSLASIGRLAARLADVDPGPLTRAARTFGLAGAVLVLPYYGAETFALHEIGRRALGGDAGALELVTPIREDLVAMTTFGLGLVSLAVSGLLVGLAWQRSSTLPGPRWAAWPLAAGIATILPQYSLPAPGRMAFGVAFAVAAFGLASRCLRQR